MSCGECMHWEGGEGPVDVNTEIETTSPPTVRTTVLRLEV
jgi:hypothetical protein